MTSIQSEASYYRSSAESASRVDEALHRAQLHLALCAPHEIALVRFRIETWCDGATVDGFSIPHAMAGSRYLKAIRDGVFVMPGDVFDEGKTMRARWAALASIVGLRSVRRIAREFPHHHMRAADDINSFCRTLCGDALVDNSMIAEVARERTTPDDDDHDIGSTEPDAPLSLGGTP